MQCFSSEVWLLVWQDRKKTTARTTDSPKCGPLCSFYHTSSLTFPVWTDCCVLKRNLMISSFKLCNVGIKISVSKLSKVLMHFESGLTLAAAKIWFAVAMFPVWCHERSEQSVKYEGKKMSCVKKIKQNKNIMWTQCPRETPKFFSWC